MVFKWFLSGGQSAVTVWAPVWCAVVVRAPPDCELGVRPGPAASGSKGEQETLERRFQVILTDLGREVL